MITLCGVRLARAPEELVDIVIKGERIASITPHGSAGLPLRENASFPPHGSTSLRPRGRHELAAGGGLGTIDGNTVIEGRGRLAMAGFIDAHVHGEAAILDDDVQLALLRQGITLVILGQDGVSFAPTQNSADTFAWATNYFTAINGKHPNFSGGSVTELLATYSNLPINVAYLAPHGTIRHAIMGGDKRAATPDEIDQMVELLAGALADGARGLSTGLEYAPSSYASRDELVALLQVVAEAGLPHVSHMRGYEERAAVGLAELVDLALATGVKTHISHYHGPGAELVDLVEDARMRGVDLTFDSYPYLRGCSILSMLTMPEWISVAEPDRAVDMLQDSKVRARLLTEHFPALEEMWSRVTLAAVSGRHVDTEGRKLVDVAREWGITPAETALELLISTRLAVGCVFAQPPTNSAESVAMLLRHPSHMGGSDAIYAGGHPHPRGWGAFAKFLADHVRTAGDWTWKEAEHHLATAASNRFSLERGQLAVGAIADIALIDPDNVTDRATYADPRQLAVGIDDVLIAGQQVLQDGQLTKCRPGRPL